MIVVGCVQWACSNTRLADEMRGAGLTEDQIRRTIVAAVVAIVETQDGPERAA